MPNQRRLRELVPRRGNRIRLSPRASAARTPHVRKALSKHCQHAPAFPKISTILFRKKAFAFRERRISHAVRASDLLRFGSGPSHVSGADARPKFQRAFAYGESNRGPCGLLLPCL